MAEISRRLFRARGRENEPLSPSTKAVLALLWTYVPTAASRSYSDGGPRPRFRRALATIAAEIELSVRQLRRHLEVLEAAALILRSGETIELCDEREQARLLHLDPFPAAPVNAARDMNDTRDAVTNDPIERHSCPFPQSEVTAILTDVSPDPLGGLDQVSNLVSERGSRARARSRIVDLRGIAQEIVKAAPTPEGAASLLPTADNLRDLLELLVAGWPREQIDEVLHAAPEIIAAGLQDRRWYGPEMFRGERWTRWRAALAQLQARRPSPAPPPEEIAARREAEERAQRERAEAEQLRRMLAALENPPTPTPFDRLHPWGHARWYVSVLFAPREAVAAGRAAIAAARGEGREVTAAELSRALCEVDVTDALTSEPAEPATEDSVLAKLREVRERAAREGRRPTLEELRSIE